MSTSYRRLTRISASLSRQLACEDFELRATFATRREKVIIRERVTLALKLLQTQSPLRYRYLQRDLPRLLIGAINNRAECHFLDNLCILRFEYVVAPTTTPEHIALLLVHEGMHARLSRLGFAYDTASRRQRIERICVMAELVISARLPNGERAAAPARARLDWSADRWTSQEFQNRNEAALLAMPRHIQSLVRMILAIRKLSRRVRRGSAA